MLHQQQQTELHSAPGCRAVADGLQLTPFQKQRVIGMEFQMMTAVMQDPRMQAEWFRESPQIDQRCVWINPRRSRKVDRRFRSDITAKASRRFGLEG